jgi:Family of unknown function (DUF6084)
MTALTIDVVDVLADTYAASPQLTATLRVEESTGAVVHAMALRCQLMIEPQRRGYDAAETATVAELFGGRDRWTQTLKPFLWTHACTVTRGFTGELVVELPIGCTYDVEVVGSKYLHALADGEVPLLFLFSGTIFSRGESGFTVEQISWNLEARHRMPVAVWRGLMGTFFPNTGYLRLDRETVNTLLQVKAARGLTSWDGVVNSLLAEASTPAGMT